MKRLTLLFISAFVAFSVTAQDVEQARVDFLAKFESAVIAHDQAAVIKLMDKKYRKAQVKFLNGNETQFVNELFGSTDMLTDEFVNVALIEIQDINILEVSEIEGVEGAWVCAFEIRTENRALWMKLDLIKRKKKFGFIGGEG